MDFKISLANSTPSLLQFEEHKVYDATINGPDYIKKPPETFQLFKRETKNPFNIDFLKKVDTKKVVNPIFQPIIQQETIIQPIIEQEPIFQPIIEQEPIIQPIIEQEPIFQPIIQPIIQEEPIFQEEPIIQPIIQPNPDYMMKYAIITKVNLNIDDQVVKINFILH
jgi:hypothetical protein